MFKKMQTNDINRCSTNHYSPAVSPRDQTDLPHRAASLHLADVMFYFLQSAEVM